MKDINEPWTGPYIRLAHEDILAFGTDARGLSKWVRELVEADRARRRYRRPSYIPGASWQAILAAFDHRCAYCGASGVPLERDHRMPLHRGGEHHARNIVPACKPCNLRKFTAHPDDWPLAVEPRWSR